MPVTPEQYRDMLVRLDKNRGRESEQPRLLEAAENEVGHGGLQEEIANYCNRQWPRWKFVQARADKRSTIAEGCQDFTIFASHGRTFLIECKAKDGKLSEAQRNWHKEMEMLSHTVFVVRSLEEFKLLVE